MNQIDTALAEFQASDYTVRLSEAIFRTLPFAPAFPAYTTLDGAIQALYPAATPAQIARAHELADSEGVKTALWVVAAIDAEDSGLAVYSGLKSALGFFFSSSKKDALETDPQQATDAGLKLLGLAYLIHKLFPGPVGDKVTLFRTAPAGQALSLYFGAIEVALPFVDNLAQDGGQFVERLMGRFGGDAASKLGTVIGGQAIQEAHGVLGSLISPIQGVVDQVAPHARRIAESAREHVPGFLATADKVAGVVATAADTLPVYKYLGARLAAESCVLLASRGQ
jgi:hypothetical protein